MARSPRRQRLPPGKRAAFSAALLLLLLVLLELLSWVTYRAISGEWFSWAAAESDRQAVATRFAGADEAGWERDREVLHPYLGFLPNPERSAGSAPIGFPDVDPRRLRRAPGRLIVAVLGGSVAHQFAEQGRAAITEALERSPAYSGRELVFANLAVPGYKQPQQLMALNYLLALGGELDLVINLDGFNEVALHEPENGKQQVFPAYPRAWYLRVASVPDRTHRARIGRLAQLEQALVGWAERLSRAPWRWSMTCNLVWKLRHDYLEGEHVVASVAVRQYTPPGRSHLVTGPSVEFAGDDELYGHLVGIWARSSLQIARLCRASGIRYYHFLQPNQYVDGSKPFTAEELAHAIDESHPYRSGAVKGYPRLVGEGRALAEAGVRFVDLTRIFAAERRTVYADDCCHVNELGNRILADRVAREILTDPVRLAAR